MFRTPVHPLRNRPFCKPLRVVIIHQFEVMRKRDSSTKADKPDIDMEATGKRTFVSRGLIINGARGELAFPR